MSRSQLTFLLLDDSRQFLQFLSEVLTSAGYGVVACEDVASASRRYKECDAALVDLYLQGEFGDQLSNDFVRDVLAAQQVPYGRVSSAPDRVPAELRGRLLYHKHELRDDPHTFLLRLKLAFE